MYFIRRDSDDMWLLGYKHGLNSSGRPTCVWGPDLRDAMPFGSTGEARTLSEAITGCSVVFKNVKGALQYEGGSANP